MTDNERIENLVEDYIKEKTSYIHDYKRKIKMWQNVERKHTKSGGDYKSLNRNFDDHVNVHRPYLSSWYVDRHGIIDGTYTEDRVYIKTDIGVEPTPDEVMQTISDHIKKLYADIDATETEIKAAPALAECLHTVTDAINKACSANIQSWDVRDNIIQL